MPGKTKKIILLSVSGIILAAAVIGYTLYNKKHFSIESTAPAAEVSAIELHQIFTTDSVLAKNKFIGDETNHKVIQVNGEIADIKKDQQGNTVIFLKTATDGAFINCTMEGKTANETVGSKIVLKGVCSGYNYDADMGIPGDVIVTRSFITK